VGIVEKVFNVRGQTSTS